MKKITAMKSRLKIPLLFGLDVIHGYKTIFPIPLAEACSWNLDQIETNSSVAAKEAASAGIHWTFAPMCDISNDPRWGRVMEGAGEDPYLASVISAKRVKGFQGNLKGNENVMACVKHFPGHGDVAVDSHLDLPVINKSMEELEQLEFYPFQKAFAAGVSSAMIAHLYIPSIDNRSNRATSLSKYNIDTLLKQKFNFNREHLEVMLNLDDLFSRYWNCDFHLSRDDDLSYTMIYYDFYHDKQFFGDFLIFDCILIIYIVHHLICFYEVPSSSVLKCW